MKYFVDDDHWDVIGYGRLLKTLLPRFNQETRRFMQRYSFHDGTVLSIHILNESNDKTKDPTKVKMVIRQYEGDVYEVQWCNVRKFSMDYDIKRNVYGNNPKEIVFGGRRGLDEWGYDEILPLSKRKLQHEILLFSQTTIIIHCSDIKIRKIKSASG